MSILIQGKRWPEDFLNRFFIGMHTVDCDQNATIPGLLSAMDGRDLIKRLADAGVDAVYFYSSCHCGNCFYPTETPRAHMHSGLNGRDVFGEAADECERLGMAFIAVYEFMNLRMAETGPREWQHYYPTAAPGNNSTEAYCNLCWNTGYGEFVIQQLEEVSARYPIAGYYVDMLNHPGLVCCEGCARRFKEAVGVAPPRTRANTPLYKAFRLWAYEEEARYLRELRAVVQAHRPGATVVDNMLLFYWEDLYETAAANDYITHDTAMVFGGRRGAVYQSALMATYRAMSRGQPPFEVLTDPILFGSLAVAPPDSYNAVTSLARLQGGATGYPSSMIDRSGRLNEAVLGLTREANTFLEARQPWRAEGEPVRFAGLYLSQESEIFYANLETRHHPASYLNSFLGAYLAAQQEHLPVDVLTRRDLERLGEYPVIILAHTVCMSDLEAEAFRAYVADGGTLLATAATSLHNEWSEPRENFALADVFGVDFAGSVITPFNALQLPLPEGRFPLEAWENPDVTLVTSGWRCAAREGADVLAHLHDRYRHDPHTRSSALQNAYTKIEPEGPGLVVNRYGRGRCIYSSSRIFDAYLATGIPTLRKLMLRWLIAEEVEHHCLVRLNAPSSVEMTAWAQPERNRVLIHLVNYQTAPGRLQSDAAGLPMTEDVLSVHDVELITQFTPQQIRAAMLQPERTTLEVVARGKKAAIRIPRLQINDVVELTLEPGACPEYPASHSASTFPRIDYRRKVQEWIATSPPSYDPEDTGIGDFSKWLPVECFLTDWSVLGLFPAGSEPALDHGEALDLEATYRADDGRTTKWQPMTGAKQCPEGCVELAALCGNRPGTVGFAVTFLRSEVEQHVAFRLGNDDTCAMYVNGCPVCEQKGTDKPGFVPDQHAFSATMKPGLNTLLVKKTHVGHGYKFFLRVEKAAHPLHSGHRPDAPGREVVIHQIEMKEWDGRGAGQA